VAQGQHARTSRSSARERKAWWQTTHTATLRALRAGGALVQTRQHAHWWCTVTTSSGDTTKRDRIRDLNDRCRTALGIGARVVQTAGVAALPVALQSRVREAVETFDAFTPHNDPHGEHDCAILDVAGVGRVIFKIAYYDQSLRYHSEDASSATLTRRVLTIMLAHEY
jgi:hypothetical protein